jgi:hypothetical protein
MFMSSTEKCLLKQTGRSMMPSAFAETIELQEGDPSEGILDKVLEEFGLDRLSPQAAVLLCQLVLKKLTA